MPASPYPFPQRPSSPVQLHHDIIRRTHARPTAAAQLPDADPLTLLLSALAAVAAGGRTPSSSATQIPHRSLRATSATQPSSSRLRLGLRTRPPPSRACTAAAESPRSEGP